MRKVLIADDDPILRNLISTLVRKQGHNPFQAANGEEALALLRESRKEGAESETFDLIILDLMMPGVSGWEVIDVLRREMPDLLGHVLVVTASGDYREQEVRPFCKVLQKPFDTREFYEAISHCMRGPRDPSAPLILSLGLLEIVSRYLGR